MNMLYDLIIGGGPAGAAAGVYAVARIHSLPRHLSVSGGRFAPRLPTQGKLQFPLTPLCSVNSLTRVKI